MYSNDQIKQIKNIINAHFESTDIVEKIKKIVKEGSVDPDQLDDNKLMEILKETKLLDNIVNDMKTLPLPKPMNKPQESQKPTKNPNTNKIGIFFKIGQGKAFLEYLGKHSPNKKLQFYISFLRYRFHTAPIQASVEPAFNEAFYFDLIDDNRSSIDLMTLSKLNAPIDLILLSHNPDGTRTLLAIKQIDWRFALVHGNVNVSLELNGIDPKNKMSIGIIQIIMDLLPKFDKSDLLPERILEDQFTQEKKQINNDVLRFYEYSTEWWNDYKKLKIGFEKRSVKIYAEDETGVFKPIFSFIKPIYGLKGIDSPFHCARFISLIPYKKDENPGGERKEIWHNFNTFLALGYGDCEDHSSLLCSMLLGYGMDAYIAVGHSSDGPHTWVITRMITQGKNANEIRKITFWESLTGQRYDQKDPRVNNLYRRIGCVFNHKRFYGNIQDTEAPFHVDFNLESEFLWKTIKDDYIQAIRSSQTYLSLMPPSLNPFTEEDDIEVQLRSLIVEYRKSLGSSTKWDDKLSSMLTPALANYELERIASVTFGQEEFQFAIKNYIPESHTFKAFPIQFNHRRVKDMFNVLKNAPICEDILNARGDSIFFALKTKIYLYPEDFHSLWVIIANMIILLLRATIQVNYEIIKPNKGQNRKELGFLEQFMPIFILKETIANMNAIRNPLKLLYVQGIYALIDGFMGLFQVDPSCSETIITTILSNLQEFKVWPLIWTLLIMWSMMWSLRVCGCYRNFTFFYHCEILFP